MSLVYGNASSLNDFLKTIRILIKKQTRNKTKFTIQQKHTTFKITVMNKT